MVEDYTTKATFVLLGMTADRIVPITVTDLARAYPNEYGPLPPVLQLLLGQQDLVIPRAQLLASLPPPPPPRSPRFGFLYPFRIIILYAPLIFTFFFFHCSCSLPARHDTLILPDPAYVPPVSIGVPLFDVLAESSFAIAATTSDGDASHQTLPQDVIVIKRN
ncbi:hypothetical protein LINGRAHAP2_LOCUS5200 [Linum grandiflorum]